MNLGDSSALKPRLLRRKRGTMWHGRAKKAAEEGRATRAKASRVDDTFSLDYMCQVTWKQNLWSGLHPSSVNATNHGAGDGHVLVTRCPGGTERMNEQREREVMEGGH